MEPKNESQMIEVELLSGQPNAAVLRLPLRQYPGILLQGDSLYIIHGMVEEALDAAKAGSPRDDLVDLPSELDSLVSGYVQAYERTLKNHGKPLPYVP